MGLLTNDSNLGPVAIDHKGWRWVHEFHLAEVQSRVNSSQSMDGEVQSAFIKGTTAEVVI